MPKDEIVDVSFDGPGPFATPLLASLKEVIGIDRQDFLVAIFRFEDGTLVHIPIANRACVELLAVLENRRAIAAHIQANKSPKH